GTTTHPCQTFPESFRETRSRNLHEAQSPLSFARSRGRDLPLPEPSTMMNVTLQRKYWGGCFCKSGNAFSGSLSVARQSRGPAQALLKRSPSTDQLLKHLEIRDSVPDF